MSCNTIIGEVNIPTGNHWQIALEIIWVTWYNNYINVERSIKMFELALSANPVTGNIPTSTYVIVIVVAAALIAAAIVMGIISKKKK